jgi:hypothetical protein
MIDLGPKEITMEPQVTPIFSSLQMSPETDKLEAAICKAQAQFPIVERNATNPHFGKTYADLGAIITATRKPLADNGITVTQWPIESKPGSVSVLTRISHAGQWMMASLTMPLGKGDAHGVGGAITYAKRFAWTAILGVAVEGEDDDGNTAVGDGNRKQGQASQKPQGSKPPQGKAQAQGGGGKPQGKEAEKAPAQKKQTFKEFLASFGWTEAQAQEWVTATYGLQEGDKSTPAMIEALRQTVQTQDPQNAIFMARNP